MYKLRRAGNIKDALSLSELYIYGSKRIGLLNADTLIRSIDLKGTLSIPNAKVDVDSILSTFNLSLDSNYSTRIRGRKRYELSNHLGNVTVVVSDRKVPVDSNSDGIVDYWNGDTRSANDYYAYGSEIKNRTYSNFKNGFNTQEKTDEVSGKGNHNTALFWEYDTRLGRRWNLDPVSTTGLSDYSCLAGNPMWKNDLLGNVAGDPSTHVDKECNVVATYDDGDNGVYVHQNGTSKNDIDKQRNELNNTGGSGKKIGEIGGKIDISGLMENKIAKSAKEAKGMGVSSYFWAVRPKGEWDLKNNKNTLFGVAWKFDLDNKDKNNQLLTKFSFGKYSNLTAADVGNYHAGYTGRYVNNGTGISYGALWLGAGTAESIKSIAEFRFGDLFKQMNEMGIGNLSSLPVPPYGDRKTDYMWNTRGMLDADNNKKQ